ncbi:hypothetical protein HPB48_000927 [Haemaphysalis longicornis]|uniref:PiggyBac transposable element-derived protein domain-containing protein n=1 Tax=Haemaphysalis longicornis TaxID=44386 RepID=A0A9J6F9M9_HAELO|nr:hypothetical protein HPB48_000927 [Haemaphysalis longicornis]
MMIRTATGLKEIEVMTKAAEYDPFCTKKHSQVWFTAASFVVAPCQLHTFVFFDALFGDAVEILVHQTNLCAKQEKIKGMQDTTKEEIRSFLGMMIKMRFHRLPKGITGVQCEPVPSINSVMPRSHFFLLLRAPHAKDNASVKPKLDSGHYSLHKVWLLITSLTRKFGDCCQPSAY